MSAFVRSRLIDEVYLPLIGDNLAKQLGTTGDVQAHRHRRPAAAHLPARLRQDDPHGVRRRPPRPGPRQGQRPGARPRGHLPRPGRGPERHRPPGGREDQLRAGGGQQHPPLPRRHPAHLARTAAEVHPAVRRAPAASRASGTAQPRTYDLRGKRFAVCMAGNPYTESGAPLPGPRHARQPRRRVEPRRRPDRQGGRLRAQLRRERAHREPGPGPARRPRPRPTSTCSSGSPQDDPTARADRLTHPYAPAELERILAVLRHLLTARDTVLAVNARLHRLGRPDRRHPHRAALPAPGLLPQHEQDRPADPAGHERRRTGGRSSTTTTRPRPRPSPPAPRPTC